MNANDWLVLLTLAAFLGATGQGARVVVGLKKHGDLAADSGQSFTESLHGSRIVISLLIGAIVGILAMVALVKPDFTSTGIPNSVVTAIIMSGYAGADFIEGFIRHATPTAKAPVSLDDENPPAFG